MTDAMELARRSDVVRMADLTRVEGVMEAVVKTPSLLVPPRVRPALFECWMAHRHLKGLETAMALAALFSVWIGRFGLTEEDAADVLQELQHPKRVAGHKFSSDVTAELANLVAARIEQRERDAQLLRDREAEEKARKAALSPEEAHERLADVIESLGRIPR